MGDTKPKPNQFWIGASLGILSVANVANLFLLLFIVPKFKQIFADALPGKALPTITEFILAARIALVIIALAWPIVSSVLVRLQKRYVILWNFVGIVWTILQIGITVIALFMPMEDIGITGMSEAPQR